MALLKTLVKLVLWLAGLGAVALAVLTFLITKIDPNEHKGRLEARFHEETGRALSLDGPIALTFYPWLGVEATNVSIADTGEFDAEPFAAMDYVQLRGKSSSLLIAILLARDLDGELSADGLAFSGARLDDLRVRLKFRDGVLRADPVTASLYEGRLSAAAVLDVNPELPALTLNVELTGIQAEPLLTDVTGRARLRGKGNFTAVLTAQGDSVTTMQRSLSGPMSLSFAEGAVTGFNLGRALRQWKQFKKGGTLAVEGAAATDFTELHANPVAEAGIIRMDDLELKAPAFRLQGTGVLADLHTGTIDYRAQASVVNTAKGAGGGELAELEGLALPLIVNGPLEDPKIRLAWEEALAGLLLERVGDALGLKLPGAQTPEEPGTGQETEEEKTDTEPLQELLEEGLKKGLKSIFKKL